jgi:ankyrin repeat protein
MATLEGSMKVLELLLAKGADGNACNKWRETPLLIAANNGHKAAVEALLKHGADPSLCSEAGWSALTFAAHKVSVDFSSFFPLIRFSIYSCRSLYDRISY